MAGAVALWCIRRGKDHGDAVLERSGQLDALLGADLAQEAVGHLHEDAGTVAGVGLTAAGTAMVQVDEHRQRLTHDFVGFSPFHIDDEPDSAGIVFELRIVEPLLLWWSDVFHVATFVSICDGARRTAGTNV